MGNLDVSVSRPEISKNDKKSKKSKKGKDKTMDDEQLMTEVATDDETRATKSVALSEDDLIKSLDKIAELTKSETPDAKKRTLLQKALSEGLSTEENADLQVLLGGGSLEPTLSDEVAKSLNPEEDSALAKSIDVSDALGEIHGGIVSALQALGETIEKGGNHQGEVNLVLAKGLLDIGKLAQQTNTLVKALDENLNAAARQPIGGRRSVVRPSDVVSKAHAGGDPAASVSKGEAMGLMSEMLQKSMEAGDKGRASELNNAITKIELLGDVDPNVMAQVADYRRQKLNGSAL